MRNDFEVPQCENLFDFIISKNPKAGIYDRASEKFYQYDIVYTRFGPHVSLPEDLLMDFVSTLENVNPEDILILLSSSVTFVYPDGSESSYYRRNFKSVRDYYTVVSCIYTKWSNIEDHYTEENFEYIGTISINSL